MAEDVSESSDSNPSFSAPFSSDELSKETPTKSSDVEIEKMFESRNNPAGRSTASDPIIIEQKKVSKTSNEKKSDLVIQFLQYVYVCKQHLPNIYMNCNIIFSLFTVVR